MAFYKLSDSNIQNNNIQEIVSVVPSMQCEKCGTELNIAKSKHGVISCQKCHWPNSITENK